MIRRGGVQAWLEFVVADKTEKTIFFFFIKKTNQLR